LSLMNDDIHTFPIAPARRKMMIFNLCVYIIGAASALWLWQDGDGVSWAVFGIVAILMALHILAVLMRRRWIARMTPDTVELMGLWGKVTRLPWDDLVAHSVDPARRTGVLFAAAAVPGAPDAAAVPGAPDAKERFAIVSLRMMGAEPALRFHDMLLARRPDLEERRSPMDEARNPSSKSGVSSGSKAGVTVAHGKASE
jgi:hypothetical protein